MLTRQADGGWVSTNSPGHDNVLFEIVAEARDLIRNGVEVELPQGYDESVLESVCWILGASGPVRVSARQMGELVAIGEALEALTGESLTREGRWAISELGRVLQLNA